MNKLGDDLLLLAARPDGTLPIPDKLRFGLAGVELVCLAAWPVWSRDHVAGKGLVGIASGW